MKFSIKFLILIFTINKTTYSRTIKAQSLDNDYKESVESMYNELVNLKNVCLNKIKFIDLNKSKYKESNFNSLSLSIKSVAKKKCQWDRLNKREKEMVKILDPNLEIKIKLNKKNNKINKKLPLPRQLWRISNEKDWESLKKETQLLIDSHFIEQISCKFIEIMNTYSKARIARSQQNRTDSYENQLALMKLIDNSNCLEKTTKIKEKEWNQFISDNILWMSRLGCRFLLV